MKHTGLGIHIALSKYPLGQEAEYIGNLKSLYEIYRDKIEGYLKLNPDLEKENKAEISNLYRPKIYHVFSHFDVAFISLIDNFKFPQRVFELWNEESKSIKSVSYQILSGSILKTSLSPDPILLLETKTDFLKIIQLKLNNVLLIGTGAALLESCIELVEKILIEFNITEYIVVNSFNWGELTILCSAKDPNVLANALMRIRLFTFQNITDGQIQSKIKLNSLFSLWKVNNIENSHLFSETLSYLGVDYSNYENVDKSIPFTTNIEWQVKPGHFPYFANEMTSSPLDLDADYSNVFFKNGKTDYLVIEKSPDSIASNIEIFNLLRKNKSLHSHIRKIKTKPLFRIDQELVKILNNVPYSPEMKPFNSELILSKYKIKNIRDVTDSLRKLNVSRNIRKKIIKIIYNYNLGIQDPILYIYFIDLHELLLQFINDLDHLASVVEQSIESGCLAEECCVNNFSPLKTSYIQKELIDVYITVFEEALDDRMLNNYNYEDINEISLDLNSPLTSIISSLDAIIKFYGSCFRDKVGNSIITTINDNATKSNKISVNYNIEHVTTVPLIFATLTKEILNIEQTANLIENSLNFKRLNTEFSQKIREKSDKEKSFLFDFLSAINFAYFEIDFKKFHNSYFRDSKLYIFWHWTYALQCTHLYSSIGYFDEVNFTRELFRLVLLLKAADPDEVSNLTCPIPELRTYWDKYFNRINGLVDLIVNIPAFNLMKESLKKQIYASINNLDVKSASASHLLSKNDIPEFLNKLGAHCKVNSEKSCDEFIDFIRYEIDKLNREGNNPTKSGYYKILSFISYYNLEMVKNKFEGCPRLLRRNYIDGIPVNHFLQTNKNWFIDPFGGFFVNSLAEREQNMLINNQMLYLIWHLGVILKKSFFIE